MTNKQFVAFYLVGLACYAAGAMSGAKISRFIFLPFCFAVGFFGYMAVSRWIAR